MLLLELAPLLSLSLHVGELLVLLLELLVEEGLLRLIGRRDGVLHLLLGAERPKLLPNHAPVDEVALTFLVLLHLLLHREHLHQVAPILALRVVEDHLGAQALEHLEMLRRLLLAHALLHLLAHLQLLRMHL